MKYLFFVFGLLLVVAGVWLAADGAVRGWDAAICGAPIGIGFLMLVASVIMHFEER